MSSDEKQRKVKALPMLPTNNNNQQQNLGLVSNSDQEATTWRKSFLGMTKTDQIEFFKNHLTLVEEDKKKSQAIKILEHRCLQNKNDLHAREKLQEELILENDALKENISQKSDFQQLFLKREETMKQLQAHLSEQNQKLLQTEEKHKEFVNQLQKEHIQELEQRLQMEQQKFIEMDLQYDSLVKEMEEDITQRHNTIDKASLEAMIEVYKDHMEVTYPTVHARYTNSVAQVETAQKFFVYAEGKLEKRQELYKDKAMQLQARIAVMNHFKAKLEELKKQQKVIETERKKAQESQNNALQKKMQMQVDSHKHSTEKIKLDTDEEGDTFRFDPEKLKKKFK